MEYITTTPERAGVPSGNIEKWLRTLEDAGLSVHNVLISRGNRILFEKYIPPFDEGFLHREYSQTKSVAAIAVGFAVQDRLVDLDDPIGKYFPEETKNIPDPEIVEQTVRQMLMMSTPKHAKNWFAARTDDRVRFYFHETTTAAPLGSSFWYDSTGSFILAAMVEKVTGKELIAYLKDKLFDKIGVSEGVKCLKCPGGHAWGDSALLATARDMMKIMRFVMDDGKVGGEQILDAGYVRAARSCLISTLSESYDYERNGYGYQIWKFYGDGYFFNGMGCQFTAAVPEKDMILVFNGDNQGVNGAGAIILDSFNELIAKTAGGELPENDAEKASLDRYADNMTLFAARGEKYSPVGKVIDGRTFLMNENPMGWKRFRVDLRKNDGQIVYENAQGEKALEFRICENRFGLFPQKGYSREVGSVPAHGNYYKCAASAAWTDERTLSLVVQIIDEYFGRLWIDLIFDGDNVAVKMRKSAEDFLDEYSGEGTGRMA